MKRLPKEHHPVAELLRRRREVVASAPLPVAARFTVSSLAVLLVCCAATAICTIVATPQGGSTTPPPAAEPIAGASALRPDLVREAVWPFPGGGRPSQTESPSPPAPLPQGKPPGPHEPSVNPHAGSMAATVDVVTELYGRLARDPAGALDLLSPQLRAEAAGTLAEAWQGVSSARTLLVDPQPGGEAIAEVEIDYPDGGRVVLRHRIAVDWHVPPHVVAVDLLTARKLHAR